MKPALPAVALTSAVLLALAARAASAQDTAADADASKPLGTIIVTGTRSDSRTESSSLTPIDVVPA